MGAVAQIKSGDRDTAIRAGATGRGSAAPPAAKRSQSQHGQQAAERNFIKCRFCNWTTRKCGHGSNTGKAFARLSNHIGRCHPDEDDKLMAFRIESAAELELWP